MSDDRETWYRVPRSAEECAVHLEAGGVVEVWRGDRWVSLEGSGVRFVDFRLFTDFRSYDYRLAYTTPVGMSPVIGAPGHACGLARHLPVGMEAAAIQGNRERIWWGADQTEGLFHPDTFIEARPPAPEPRIEKVPLTKLVGRTLVGETEAVDRIEWVTAAAARDCRPRWRWHPKDEMAWLDFPDGAVDVESGLVEVLAEEEA